MRNKPSCVFDTNTLVSAALFRGGTPGEAFRHALKTGVVLLSQERFEEIDEVIARERFDDYLTPEVSDGLWIQTAGNWRHPR